ncbi:MAG: hypothetical protein M0030_07845 [Actinomycetota bacterium]|nr:hypothetical protein [Actinomycetota bacterium]
MSDWILTGIEIASGICAVITVGFVLFVRLVWRRGKTLREP